MAQTSPSAVPDSPTASLSAIAREHLPSDMAERWTALLRPAGRLTAARGTDAVVGRLGGLPELPGDVEWPVWERHGPLSFIASVDCAALPSGVLDIPLPTDGTLSFFYFDGQVDDGDALVLPDEPESRDGARVLYTPVGVAASERATPPELEPYPMVPLTAVVQETAPDACHPLIEETFADAGHGDHPLHGDEFLAALEEAGLSGRGHRIGGHADPVQGSVEAEVAQGALGPGTRWDDPRLAHESRAWTLLAQFDSDGDAGMMWGDCGALYWLIRPEDLAERRFEAAMFTWQCC
ncbi:YwqG family protein [Streptomyces syringium]|uniref:YwqG family protein n=1 Tax=Streptomyces syringium TaxID=76729 RepID=UPI003651097D